MNLATMVDMKERFKVPIGLSDHSLGSLGAVTAVAMEACIIEKHFCISREIENPEAAFSMTKDEFKQMVKDIRDAVLNDVDILYDWVNAPICKKIFLLVI